MPLLMKWHGHGPGYDTAIVIHIFYAPILAFAHVCTAARESAWAYVCVFAYLHPHDEPSASMVLSNLLLLGVLICVVHVARYENLVLQGGGIKGLAYIGMMKALEELNILQHVKRFAGASVGALVALFVALGMNSEQLMYEIGLLDWLTLIKDNHAFGENHMLERRS